MKFFFSERFCFGVICLLFLLNFFLWQTLFGVLSRDFLEVRFLAIGQGDAIFIQTPKFHQILIDGGPDKLILEKLSKLMPFWDRTIDLVILTHPQKDHLAGLIEVLKRYRVLNILWTGVFVDSFIFQEWQKRLTLEKANEIIAEAGQKIIFEKLIFDVLNPGQGVAYKFFKNSNDTSLVLRAHFGESSFLFTGDIEKKVEENLINQKIKIESDVLKVAHHGSKSSSVQEFLEKVSPFLSVISVGFNNYGHPHQEVLERLEKIGSQILRTDREGDIILKTDGKIIFLETAKKYEIPAF
jgi:competence protein ComEC